MLPPNQNGFVQIILGHVTLFTVQTTGIGCNRYYLLKYGHRGRLQETFFGEMEGRQN